MKLYSDVSQKIDKLVFTDIKNYNEKGIILIFNKKFNFENRYLESFIITNFKSKYADFEILSKDDNIIDTLYFFINKLKDNFPKKKKEKLESIDKNFRIKNIDTFNGIYINSILLKEGSLRFFTPLEIFFSIFKEKFTGVLKIKDKEIVVFKLYFKNGELRDIISYIKENSFQYYLKEFAYISEINTNLIHYSIENQIDDLIDKNHIFFSERELIIKDYFIFLIKKLFDLNTGFFTLRSNVVTKIEIFENYYNFLSNFINFSQKIDKISYNQTFKLNIKHPPVFENNDINKTFHLIKSNADFQAIKVRVSPNSNYIIKIIDFLIELNLISFDNTKDFSVTENDVLSTVEIRVQNWFEKIKNEDYFSILGVSLKDNKDYIKKKYKLLSSQFIQYKSSKEIYKRFSNEIDAIIFELDSAYDVLSNDNLKENYFNNRL